MALALKLPMKIDMPLIKKTKQKKKRTIGEPDMQDIAGEAEMNS